MHEPCHLFALESWKYFAPEEMALELAALLLRALHIPKLVAIARFYEEINTAYMLQVWELRKLVTCRAFT